MIIKKQKVNKKVFLVVTIVAAALAFIAFVAMFFPAVNMSVKGILGTYETQVSGLHAVFGGKITEGNEHFQLTVAEYGFNALAFIGYLLPLLSLVIGYFAYKGKGEMFNYIAAILCIVGAILIFLEPTFAIIVSTETAIVFLAD